MRQMSLLVLLAACAVPPGTSGDSDSDAVDDSTAHTDSGHSGGSGLVWWLDPCGRRDPVDRTCADGVDTVEVGSDPTCADAGFAAGEGCSPDGATCLRLRPLACADAPTEIIASDEVMWCGVKAPDPTCPISLREAKQDLAYLDAAARQRVAQDALALKLATYTYRDPAHGVGPQLGYVLDDAPGAVFSAGDHVNLYAYTTAVLAAVQAHEAELAALREEVARLRSSCAPP